MKKKRFALLLALALFTALLGACGKEASTSTAPVSEAAPAGEAEPTGTEAGGDGPTIVTVAHNLAYVPYSYLNENDEPDGFEVQVLKLVDELLEDYEFQYVATTDDDLLIGVESGKYDIGVKGAWYTEERLEKFLFPENYIAASSIGITFRSENADEITDLASFAAFSGKLVPIAPQNAQYAVVAGYNEENPDNQIDLVAAESFDVAEAYLWVLEGRYDAYFDIKTSYEANVVAEDGFYNSYADQLSYVVYRAIPTYPLFYKGDAELVAAYDAAMEELLASGVLVDLQYEYFGEELFQYVVD